MKIHLRYSKEKLRHFQLPWLIEMLMTNFINWIYICAKHASQNNYKFFFIKINIAFFIFTIVWEEKSLT